MVRHLHAVFSEDDWQRLKNEIKPDDFTWNQFILEAGELFQEHVDSELSDDGYG